MLAALGFDSLDALMDAAVPGGIRAAGELGLPRRRDRGSRRPASCARSRPATRPASR